MWVLMYVQYPVLQMSFFYIGITVTFITALAPYLLHLITCTPDTNVFFFMHLLQHQVLLTCAWKQLSISVDGREKK